MLAKSFVALSLVSLAIGAPLERRVTDFGTCSNPTIIFANGLDGRNTAAFAPANPGNFNHGSALNIGVIASFICGQLQSACKAPAATNTACTAAESAAAGATGQAAADAFNKALTGSTSTGSAASGASGAAASAAPAAASEDAGSAAAAASAAPAAASADAGSAGADCPPPTTVTVTAAASVDTGAAAAASADPAAADSAAPAAASAAPAAASAAGSAAPAAASAASGSGGNVQTFTGALGGIAAPPVLQGGGKGFITDNSEFINASAAIGRSCDVQHNACANAANSGGGFTVAQCDAQDTACKQGAQ